MDRRRARTGYRSRSCRLTSVLRQPLLAGSPALAIVAGDVLRRNRVLYRVAPREPHEDRICCEQPQTHHPPDVPNEREAGHGGEERRDESGGTVAWDLDRFILGLCRQLLRLDRAPLD